MSSGIISLMPMISSRKVVTIVAAPSEPIDPRAVNAATRTAILIETAAADTENERSDALSCKIDPIIGLSSFAATPITVNAPARIIRPWPAFIGSISTSAAIPAARDVIRAPRPIPTAAVPTPKITSEPPNAAIDPAKENIEGISGFNILVAKPTIVMAPASAIKLVATPIIPVFEIRTIAPASATRATETSISDATELSLPLTACMPIARAPTAPTRAIVAAAAFSMLILPILLIASASIPNDAARIGIVIVILATSPTSSLLMMTIMPIMRPTPVVRATND